MNCTEWGFLSTRTGRRFEFKSAARRIGTRVLNFDISTFGLVLFNGLKRLGVNLEAEVLLLTLAGRTEMVHEV
jgi:hypothetical protein